MQITILFTVRKELKNVGNYSSTIIYIYTLIKLNAFVMVQSDN